MTESKFQQGLSNPLAIVSDGKPVLVLVPTHNHSVDGESVRKFASMLGSHPELVKALEAIAIALKEPAGGEYWTARKFLDEHNVWHGDLDDTRVLLKVAEAALTAAGK